MTTRREARTLALQAMFQMDVGRQTPETALENVLSDVSEAHARGYVQETVLGAWKELALLDRVITSRASNWKLDRLNRVDRTILRLALYEMLFREDIPPPVSINEAVELAREYGGDESGSFVNGILGSLVPDHGGSIDREKIMQEIENVEPNTLADSTRADAPKETSSRRKSTETARRGKGADAPGAGGRRTTTRKADSATEPTERPAPRRILRKPASSDAAAPTGTLTESLPAEVDLEKPARKRASRKKAEVGTPHAEPDDRPAARAETSLEPSAEPDAAPVKGRKTRAATPARPATKAKARPRTSGGDPTSTAPGVPEAEVTSPPPQARSVLEATDVGSAGPPSESVPEGVEPTSTKSQAQSAPEVPPRTARKTARTRSRKAEEPAEAMLQQELPFEIGQGNLLETVRPVDVGTPGGAALADEPRTDEPERELQTVRADHENEEPRDVPERPERSGREPRGERQQTTAGDPDRTRTAEDLDSLPSGRGTRPLSDHQPLRADSVVAEGESSDGPEREAQRSHEGRHDRERRPREDRPRHGQADRQGHVRETRSEYRPREEGPERAESGAREDHRAQVRGEGRVRGDHREPPRGEGRVRGDHREPPRGEGRVREEGRAPGHAEGRLRDEHREPLRRDERPRDEYREPLRGEGRLRGGHGDHARAESPPRMEHREPDPGEGRRDERDYERGDDRPRKDHGSRYERFDRGGRGRVEQQRPRAPEGRQRADWNDRPRDERDGWRRDERIDRPAEGREVVEPSPEEYEWDERPGDFGERDEFYDSAERDAPRDVDVEASRPAEREAPSGTSPQRRPHDTPSGPRRERMSFGRRERFESYDSRRGGRDRGGYSDFEAASYNSEREARVERRDEPDRGQRRHEGRRETRETRGEVPRGEAPRGEAPRGEAPRGEAPRGEAPRGEAPRGEAPRGEAPRGEVRDDRRGEGRGEGRYERFERRDVREPRRDRGDNRPRHEARGRYEDRGREYGRGGYESAGGGYQQDAYPRRYDNRGEQGRPGRNNQRGRFSSSPNARYHSPGEVARGDREKILPLWALPGAREGGRRNEYRGGGAQSGGYGGDRWRGDRKPPERSRPEDTWPDRPEDRRPRRRKRR